MPEYPEIELYLHALRQRVLGRTLERVRLGNPFLLRTVSPPLSEAAGKQITDLRRLGKRIVFGLEGGLFLVLHLMIAGRLHWKKPGAKLGSKNALAALDFDDASLVLTEAGSKRRAGLYLVRGEAALAELDPGGIELFSASPEEFYDALTRESHTLKRSLTDPRLLSGIGNAYSDEILHRARLSPFVLTSKLSREESDHLFGCCKEVLREWADRLIRETGEAFPEGVTAFRPEMAVHGKYAQPCPVCGEPVQRIVYADNEANYCARCQTGGRVLADRSLSRLLGSDWPRSLEELEERHVLSKSVRA